MPAKKPRIDARQDPLTAPLPMFLTIRTGGSAF